MQESKLDLEAAVAALRQDYGHLVPRIRALEHAVVTSCSKLTLRLHYPALRNGQPTMGDLVDAIALHIPHFCLPRRDIQQVYSRIEQASPSEIHRMISALDARAVDLFMRAQAATGRSGEAGELLLYILTEWVLEAPQIVAKMSLKTNRDMPVHGSDGIHVKFLPGSGQLLLFSGEAKLHRRVREAVRSAVSSIVKALEHTRLSREIELVRRDIDLTGLAADAKEALLAYLDPFDERSNQRLDVITCLIGFNFAGYRALLGQEDAEALFEQSVRTELEAVADAFSTELITAGLSHQLVEVFLLPLPSVDNLREAFSKRIGVAI